MKFVFGYLVLLILVLLFNYGAHMNDDDYDYIEKKGDKEYDNKK